MTSRPLGRLLRLLTAKPSPIIQSVSMTKKNAAGVPESPISEINEDRRPSESEKRWAEKTLLPSLEKAPEKPIGASTGVNVDEHGRARFTTISGVPVRRLY